MVSIVVRNKNGMDEIFAENPNIIKRKELTGNYLVVEVPEEEVFSALELMGNTKIDTYSLVVGLLGQVSLDASGIAEVHRLPYIDLQGRGVLLGFVDTGIAYTQAAFKYEDNTSKIQYIWDQTIEGQAPDGFNFGTEYSSVKINEALQAGNPFDVVPHQDTVGHGTFLASVAGSREEGEYKGAAPESEIIMVKIRSAGAFFRKWCLIPPEQENAFETSDVMQGIEYILEKAAQLNRPVAICISLGTNMGGHDGFTLFEEYMSRISHETGIALCCAVGNECDKAHHTSGTIAEMGSVEVVDFNVPENSSDIFMHIMTNASDKVSVSVISPTGELIGRVPAKNGLEATYRLLFEKSVVSIIYFFPAEGSGSQITFIEIQAPTPGIWKVQIHGDIIISGKYDMWLPMTGFVSPGVEFLSPSPDCTIVVPACATGVIACGAFDALSKSVCPDSSWGPTRLPAVMPDIMAPGASVLGVFPTGYGSMDGTSVAAAITTGACALLLQWGIVDENEVFMDSYLLRADLIRGCFRDEGITYPNNQWGYGRLDLQNTFKQMRVI